ncbi:MAG: hypothetical protein KatS3mg057_2992 [Herpetosiphonaceae bacterium]|nr:MAG: hypothetical protein KatS3mg057_2992 [Herpetosiphonaceae bacterium]
MTTGPLGTVTIAPGVLSTIVSLTAQEVPGVARLGSVPGNQRVGHLWDGTAASGVLVRVVEDAVMADCYIVAQPETNLVQLGKAVQEAVTRALRDMVGMPVRTVNVYIQDVEQRRAEG